jgi:MraZ protein
MFIGEYTHNIDTKKRLALPAKFRGELGARVIITRGLDKCLFVYPIRVWETIA